MIEFHAAIFGGCRVYFRTCSSSLVAYHLDRGGMAFHDAFGVNSKKDTTTDIKAQVSWIIVHALSDINTLLVHANIF